MSDHLSAMSGGKRISKKIYNCIRQTSKKYTTRNSPPYSAQSCQNKKMKGNDGKLYVSLLGPKSYAYKWYPYSDELIKSNKERFEKARKGDKIRRKSLKLNRSKRKRRTTNK